MPRSLPFFSVILCSGTPFSKSSVQYVLMTYTKPTHAGNNSWGFIFSRIHVAPVFAHARIQEIIIEGSFSAYLPNSWGNSFRCKYMSRLYSHPREYRKHFLANYLCIGFVPRPRKQKIPKDIGPSSAFGTQCATAKRGVHFFKKHPSKNPLSLGSRSKEEGEGEGLAVQVSFF